MKNHHPYLSQNQAIKWLNNSQSWPRLRLSAQSLNAACLDVEARIAYAEAKLSAHKEMKMTVKRIIRLLQEFVRLLPFSHYQQNMNEWTDLVHAESILLPLTCELGTFDDDMRDRYLAETAYYIDNAIRTLYGEMYTGVK